MFSTGDGLIIGLVLPSERAKELNTLYFTMLSGIRKRRSNQTPCILDCSRAFGESANFRRTPGKFPAANSRQTPGKIRHNPESVHLKGLSSDARIVRPTYILQCFRTFGEDEAAQKRIFYNVFAPSERAKEPNTVYFTLFSHLWRGRGGPKAYIS